jgi:molybdopterin synthase catalytic subunit
MEPVTCGNIIVEISKGELNPELLRQKLDLHGSGSVVSFVGITRDVEEGVDVIQLEFDAWEQQLEGVLHTISEKALSKFPVNCIALSHRVGIVGPSEPIVAIHVASTHRAEGFAACSWVIDELKSQAPLWKKEVRIDGTIWKGGLG